MSGWQKGDLALCVKHTKHEDRYAVQKKWSVKKGGVYTVKHAQWYNGACPAGFGLRFEEDTCDDDFSAWYAGDFRKITPPKADEFDREVIDLMTGQPVGEPA